MALTYKEFLEKDLDLAPLGVERNASFERYFCTPLGAVIIGSSGVDGIHFCMINDFGEMVFAVSPLNGVGSYVHPIAENFADFLSLLVTVGGSDAIEQAWMCSPETFDRFLRENPPTEEQKKGMEQFVRREFHAKGVVWEMEERPSLIGGFLLLVNGREYDYSMQGRLKRLEQKLTWR